jgi:probable O-glycosylation ligase (exosortase A-associated)
MAASIGFYGVKGGLFALATGGNYMVFGPPNSFIADNTSLGISLCMVLPLMFFLSRAESNPRIRLAWQSAFCLTLLGAVFTYSRGAFLGIVVVMGLLFLHLGPRSRAVAILLGLVSIPVVFTLLPEHYIDRIETISTYEEDGSANARFNAWRAAWNVALARPLTGGGFQIIDDVPAVQQFDPRFTVGDLGVHSVYFEVLAENGFITFLVFVALLTSTILGSWSLSRRFADSTIAHPFTHYGRMVFVSLCAYAVTGAFLEFASFDLFYHFVALTIIMKRLAPEELARLAAPAPDALPDAARTIVRSPYAWPAQRTTGASKARHAPSLPKVPAGFSG